MPVSHGLTTTPQSRAKRAFYRRLIVVAGFLFLLVVLGSNTFLARRQLDVQIENRTRVADAVQLSLELERTESLLKDAEIAERGYIDTGAPEYLANFNLAASQIESRFQSLARLTAADTRQQEHLTDLRTLIDAESAELSQAILLRRMGNAKQAKAIRAQNADMVAMNRTRSLAGEMENDETVQEAAKEARYQASVHTNVVRIFVAALLRALCLVLMGLYILRQINQNEEYEHTIRKSEEWYRATLTGIGDAVIATNERGEVTFMNPAAETLTGTSGADAVGKKIMEVAPILNEFTRRPVENPAQTALDKGHAVALASHLIRNTSEGTVIPVEDSVAPIRDDRGNLVGVVLVLRDVAMDRRVREALHETEKLAAAARVSATIAHEINNPLEAVGNLIFLAKTAEGVPPHVVQSLAIAEMQLERVAQVTRQTLGFYRESEDPELVELPALVESVINLHANKLKNKNIQVRRHFEECPRLLGVPGELKQVVSNLIANAADAVGNGGTITVRTACIDEPEGKVMHIAIEDDGPGIDPEHMDRIFEPFFTTKKDVGAGLGLWAAREIVNRHGGRIHAIPRKDASGGAAFNIFLPCGPEFSTDATENA